MLPMENIDWNGAWQVEMEDEVEAMGVVTFHDGDGDGDGGGELGCGWKVW